MTSEFNLTATVHPAPFIPRPSPATPSALLLQDVLRSYAPVAGTKVTCSGVHEPSPCAYSLPYIFGGVGWYKRPHLQPEAWILKSLPSLVPTDSTHLLETRLKEPEDCERLGSEWTLHAHADQVQPILPHQVLMKNLPWALLR